MYGAGKLISRGKWLIMFFGLIIAFQLLNHIAWQHFHVMPDGTLITHAHPYSKDAQDKPVQHQHSEQHFFLLDKLQVLFFLLLSSIGLLTLLGSKYFFVSIKEKAGTVFLHPNYGRAPPALLLA